jgi:hypothetical protein
MATATATGTATATATPVKVEVQGEKNGSTEGAKPDAVKMEGAKPDAVKMEGNGSAAGAAGVVKGAPAAGAAGAAPVGAKPEVKPETKPERKRSASIAAKAEPLFGIPEDADEYYDDGERPDRAVPYTWELDKGYKEMKNIVEPEPEKACEHFETRQAFLQLCQLNHYQFDQLRRAKHSSMMVLYHLHNPEAPVDAATCNSCHSSINQGVRWHCATCNFDICSECKEGGKVKHPHELTSMSVAMTEDEKAQDKKAREERQRSIQLHMQLLVHASGCRNQLVLSPPPPCIHELVLLHHC